MIRILNVKTNTRMEAVDITAQVMKIIGDSGVENGICVVFVPHTTAGVTVNESYDPSVALDILDALEKMAPRSAGYRHMEGNADAHVKTSLVGNSASLIIESGRPILGRWGGVFLMEFDGPRERTVYVKILEG
ncbi:MAG: YjbQ family protein [Thermotogae bacterium]|nr:MAG: YjbQ family protein [Thermotogota bacterium]